MHILESPWFTSLVEKRAESAKGRLQAVFSIAGEWLAAPGIREQFSSELGVPSDFPQLKSLAREALRAGAAQHEVLATQLLMLLTGAIAEQLRQPSLSVMQDATKASETLIHNACRNPRSRKLAASGIAAGVLLTGLAIILHQPAFQNPSRATSTLVTTRRRWSPRPPPPSARMKSRQYWRCMTASSGGVPRTAHGHVAAGTNRGLHEYRGIAWQP